VNRRKLISSALTGICAALMPWRKKKPLTGVSRDRLLHGEWRGEVVVIDVWSPVRANAPSPSDFQCEPGEIFLLDSINEHSFSGHYEDTPT
jgi:hypothetical protein